MPLSYQPLCCCVKEFWHAKGRSGLYNELTSVSPKWQGGRKGWFDLPILGKKRFRWREIGKKFDAVAAASAPPAGMIRIPVPLLHLL
jgi:hypothetical protein